MRLRMTSGQWVTGCLVMLAATVGGALSAPWAERTFARPAALASELRKKRRCLAHANLHHDQWHALRVELPEPAVRDAELLGVSRQSPPARRGAPSVTAA